jgi:hypothetical protein
VSPSSATEPDHTTTIPCSTAVTPRIANDNPQRPDALAARLQLGIDLARAVVRVRRDQMRQAFPEPRPMIVVLMVVVMVVLVVVVVIGDGRDCRGSRP